MIGGNMVLLPWACKLTLMQQSVLISAVRGPDGLEKNHPVKDMIKWYRRCVMYVAFGKVEYTHPFTKGGGSFTGPSVYSKTWDEIIKNFFDYIDILPFHYLSHFSHASMILGYKHPDHNIRLFWFNVYSKMCKKFHATIQTEQELDERLNDNEEDFNKRNDIK